MEQNPIMYVLLCCTLALRKPCSHTVRTQCQHLYISAVDFFSVTVRRRFQNSMNPFGFDLCPEMKYQLHAWRGYLIQISASFYENLFWT